MPPFSSPAPAPRRSGRPGACIDWALILYAIRWAKRPGLWPFPLVCPPVGNPSTGSFHRPLTLSDPLFALLCGCCCWMETGCSPAMLWGRGLAWGGVLITKWQRLWKWSQVAEGR